MPEDAGKKKFIQIFLNRVRGGEGFIEDIWINRVIRPPGAEGEASTARSLSGRTIKDITELLEDDLQHCFDDGYFTFRFISAFKGSGKTSLLTYLDELTKTKQTYEKLSVFSHFQLSDLLTTGGNHSFSVKLYCYILAKTFWGLLNSSSLPIQNIAKEILSDYLEKYDVNQLTSATKFAPFSSKFSSYFAQKGVVFEQLFFEVIDQISKIEPLFTFAYLIDELDSLQNSPNSPNEIMETRYLLRALIKRVSQEFGLKIRLLIYLAGTSANIDSFINQDSVIESLVGDSVINLQKGYKNEFEMIRAKIDNRIEGAFKGYKKFDQAWHEIKDIPLKSAQDLRMFCKEYATALLQIYHKYFQEAPEQKFEGNSRDLVKAQCRQKWHKYLNQKYYTLCPESTTKIVDGHAFDCYIELRHNNVCVARAFGEAKNYELLSEHLKTFDEWLTDAKFKPSTSGNTPPDLAFMIAPSCPHLLQRKLELKNIHFLQSDKVVEQPKLDSVIDDINPATPNPVVNMPININTAEKDSIVNAFIGTRLHKKTVDKLINNRTKNPYKNLEELATDLKLTLKVKSKLQNKLDEGKICFGVLDSN
jgi:hypothetical protein